MTFTAQSVFATQAISDLLLHGYRQPTDNIIFPPIQHTAMARPPLGDLRGMWFDPERNRYFPDAMKPVNGGSTSASASDSNNDRGSRRGGPQPVRSAGTGFGRKRGRKGIDHIYDVKESEEAARRIQRSFGARRDDSTRL